MKDKQAQERHQQRRINAPNYEVRGLGIWVFLVIILWLFLEDARNPGIVAWALNEVLIVLSEGPIMELLVIWITAIIVGMIVANNKNLSLTGAFFSTFCLGPVAVIILLVLPSKKAEKALAAGREKICPHCGEQILAVAKVCRFCNRDLIEVRREIEEL